MGRELGTAPKFMLFLLSRGVLPRQNLHDLANIRWKSIRQGRQGTDHDIRLR
jgi:hypothetical protein